MPDGLQAAGGRGSHTMPSMRRVAAGVVLAMALAGCGLVPVGDQGPPVPAGPLGPIVPAEGGGPPIECRGVPIEQCQAFGPIGMADVVRYIITCTSVCTPQKGDVRIDALRSNGTTESMGGGSYSSAEAAPAS
jgi:hypothetical protein